MPDRRQQPGSPPTEVPPPGRPGTTPEVPPTDPRPTVPETAPPTPSEQPGVPTPGAPPSPGAPGLPEAGTTGGRDELPPMPEPPAPWLKDRPDRKRGTGEPGRRREDEHDPNGPRRG